MNVTEGVKMTSRHSGSSMEESDIVANTDSCDNVSLNSAERKYQSDMKDQLVTDPNVSLALSKTEFGKGSSSSRTRGGSNFHSALLSTQQQMNSSTSSSARTSVNRKESYKAQRKSYAKEKKRVEKELLSTFKDQSIIILADWLKVRGTLKSWTKLWCVLKPGILLIYRSQKAKSSHWIGTIILSTCELIERPSKKDGFCFKLFHPMDQSIWAARGPNGEAIGAVVQPLPTSHLIFRAPNNNAGKCWMDALELALRCSSLLLRTMNTSQGPNSEGAQALGQNSDEVKVKQAEVSEHSMNESDLESQFRSELCDTRNDGEEDGDDEANFDDDDLMTKPPPILTDDSDFSDEEGSVKKADEGTSSIDQAEFNDDAPVSTNYEQDPNREIFGTAHDQTEEFSDDNKSILWFLVKQVRPGMDLSKVVLPTFILEPRSFLDKLSDYHYHNDILAEAIKDESPYNRMKKIVKWYFSGFYKKPKGLKKPYNPILGEKFRCYWEHPNGSKTFYIAEQVSHHPPISAFYVANRKEGFTISSSILAKSKFYGNSTSAILDGLATLSLLPRGEEYRLTMPYAHCKGILMGTMTMELGGKVTIDCPKTGYSAEIEFKLRPFLGGGEFTNAVSGKIRLGKETLATLSGRWDDTIKINEKESGSSHNTEIFWQVTDEVRKSRLPRYTVPLSDQSQFESVKLWQKVSKAIQNEDQNMATEEKSLLEEAQRAGARERKALGKDWVPAHFVLNPVTNQYEYIHADARPWDELNDLYQYEHDFVVRTKTKHKAPMVRTQSIVSVNGRRGSKMEINSLGAGNDSAPPENRSPIASVPSKGRRRRNTKEKLKTIPQSEEINLTSDDAPDGAKKPTSMSLETMTTHRLQEALKPLEEHQKITNDRLNRISQQMELMMYQQRERDSRSNVNRDMVLLVVLVVMIQAVLNWVLTHKAQMSDSGASL